MRQAPSQIQFVFSQENLSIAESSREQAEKVLIAETATAKRRQWWDWKCLALFKECENEFDKSCLNQELLAASMQKNFFVTDLQLDAAAIERLQDKQNFH